jgi:hypothetical protein
MFTPALRNFLCSYLDGETKFCSFGGTNGAMRQDERHKSIHLQKYFIDKLRLYSVTAQIRLSNVTSKAKTTVNIKYDLRLFRRQGRQIGNS